MMLNTKTFVPRTLQLKLHIEAQISSGVLVLREHFSQVECSSCGDDSIYFAVQIIEEIFRGSKLPPPKAVALANCAWKARSFRIDF